jgi:threonine/homoserine/homoserine lactone efflux protein
MAFTVLKYLGAAYLAWLAWQSLRPRPRQWNAAGPRQGPSPSERPAASAWRMVGRGMVMNLTNPKVLIFFLAFLPQFANPALGSVAPQIMLLGVVFMLATLLVFGAIAVFSGTFGTLLLRSARAQTLAQPGGGRGVSGPGRAPGDDQPRRDLMLLG